MNTLFWAVRRELWENRSIYIGPLAVAGIILVGFAVALAAWPARVQAASALGVGELREAVQQPFVVAALMLMIIEILVAIVYSLDALYSERRDRSILFWKSMPVSDLETVFAKASIPILVLPLVTFVVTMGTQVVMLLMGSVGLAAKGISVGILWGQLSLLDLTRINLVHLVTFHGILWAPLFAWLLLVSAWAPRAPFLWAVLPPVAVGIAERIAFNSTYFATLLRDYFLGGSGGEGSSGMTMDMLAPHQLSHFVTRPDLWLGLAVGTAMLFGAVKLRRARGAI
jgi:ABC-2 type transport system permease protein